MKKNICLIGMSGVGKSTFGKEIADILCFDFIDIDIEMVKTCPEWKTLSQEDPKKLKEIEEGICLSLPKTLQNTILAPGGSIVYSEAAISHLKEISTLIYLKNTAEGILKKIGNPKSMGIVGLKDKSFQEILEERAILYSKYADKELDIEKKSNAEILKELKLIIGCKSSRDPGVNR